MNDSKTKRKRHNEGDDRHRGPPRRRQHPHSGSNGNNFHHSHNSTHRFGRVMSQPPKLKVHPSRRASCHPTVSIAIPGSFVSNAQTRELQTQLAGQIARAAAVYRVDEIVVFDDGLGSQLNTCSNYRRGPSRAAPARTGPGPKDGDEDRDAPQPASKGHERDETHRPAAQLRPSTDPHAFLARLLQYIECPQYLRRKFFPMHPDLQFAGLLPPLDAPHHLRRGDVATFREGVVVARGREDGPEDEEEPQGGSLVECGVPNRVVRIDRVLTPGIRCTVKLDIKAYVSKGQHAPANKKGVSVMTGEVVSPTTPRDEEGIYWGYATRMAASINAIFEECPYEGGYDLKVGTSERGDVSIDDPKFCLGKKKQQTKKRSSSKGDDDDDEDNSNRDERFNHLLIVFGGVAGIEESVDADESMALSGEDSKKMFDVWVNICPYQGSRTIRTEEAVFIGLSRLSPHIAKNGAAATDATGKHRRGTGVVKTEDVAFSDEALSEESSEGE